MSLTQIRRSQMQTPTATAAQLADKTHAINTTDKYLAKQVWVTDATKVVYATGTTDVSVWNSAAGALAYTPI